MSAPIVIQIKDLVRSVCGECGQAGPHRIPEGTPPGMRVWKSDGTLTITPYRVKEGDA